MDSCRALFGSQGSLNGTITSGSGVLYKYEALNIYRINCELTMRRPDLAYALTTDLGNITNTESPIVWAFGLVRNPVVSYTKGSGQSQIRMPYFLTQYNGIEDAVSLHAQRRVAAINPFVIIAYSSTPFSQTSPMHLQGQSTWTTES